MEHTLGLSHSSMPIYGQPTRTSSLSLKSSLGPSCKVFPFIFIFSSFLCFPLALSKRWPCVWSEQYCPFKKECLVSLLLLSSFLITDMEEDHLGNFFTKLFYCDAIYPVYPGSGSGQSTQLDCEFPSVLAPDLSKAMVLNYSLHSFVCVFFK